MLRGILLLMIIACGAALSRVDEECEACGLIVWRMQTIVSAKQLQLEGVKSAKEKRAKKSSKAHSRRWIRQEYAVELAGAIEEQIDALPDDDRMVSGACRHHGEAVAGSALRRLEGMLFDHQKCRARVRSHLSALIGDQQDELMEGVVAGKSAGKVCASLVEGCSAARAQHLLGDQYKEGMGARELEHLQVGYGDRWTVHEDVDGSIYWFNKQKMKSVLEPPEGWAKGEDGKWAYQGPRVAAKEAKQEL